MNNEFTCEFCNKSFIREGSFFAHSCAKKMRWLDKENKNNVLGFTAYKRFYTLTGFAKKRQLGMKDFIESKYYNDFVSFGRFLNDAMVVAPEAYIDHVIKNSIKLKDWTKPSVYETFLKSLTFKEDPEDAIERSLIWIQDWCNEKDIQISEFFKTISVNRLVDAMRSGKISPWLMYVCNTGVDVLNNFDSSQVKLLGPLLEQKVWSYKLHKNQKLVKEYKEMLSEIGL